MASSSCALRASSRPRNGPSPASTSARQWLTASCQHPGRTLENGLGTFLASSHAARMQLQTQPVHGFSPAMEQTSSTCLKPSTTTGRNPFVYQSQMQRTIAESYDDEDDACADHGDYDEELDGSNSQDDGASSSSATSAWQQKQDYLQILSLSQRVSLSLSLMPQPQLESRSEPQHQFQAGEGVSGRSAKRAYTSLVKFCCR